MKKLKKKKVFRVNVVIHYWLEVDPYSYRAPLQELIRHLAWLYELEYAISENNPFEPVPNSSEHGHEKEPLVADLVYLRSTKGTHIELKDLKRLIVDLAKKSFLPIAGVNMSYQLQKALSEFPFPKDYYRPLNYPYIEGHHNGEVKVYIPKHALCDLDLQQ